MTSLNDKELRNAVGGTDTTTYKYEFYIGDVVYIGPEKTIHYLITDEVKTNDGNAKVPCERKDKNGNTSIIDDNTVYKSASDLMYYYECFGGHLAFKR